MNTLLNIIIFILLIVLLIALLYKKNYHSTTGNITGKPKIVHWIDKSLLFGFWFPFYYEIKIVLLIWILSPQTRGGSFIYR